MKKILLIICLFPILVFSQKSYKIPADSTILNNIGSGKNELVIRNATSNITGGVLTNLGNGVTAFVLGGGSARVVDTIYKNSAKDSIVFTISGVRYAVKDSFNLNTDSQTLSISNDTLTISGGNSVILPVYVQADSSTIFSYDVLNSQNAPPGSPAIGDTYLVGNSPSGAWAGHAKDIAEWNGSAWVFTDGLQGDFLYNATNALTYIFRSGNWVQTTGIPALNNGNSISSGLRIGTNNARSLTFETNNVNRGRFDSIGRFHVYNLPTSSTSDTFVTKSDLSGKLTKVGQSTFLSGVNTSLFPNGIKMVTESRDFEADDVGHILVVASSNIHLTMPLGITFENNKILGIKLFGGITNVGYESMNGILINPFIDVYDGEFITLYTTDFAGNSNLVQISGNNVSDNGVVKTALRYLYDQSQNAIPLSGTEVGKPVTGDISIQDDLLWSLKNNQQEIVFNDDGSGVQIKANSSTEQGILNIGTNMVTVSSTDTISRGISGLQDYTANITDLDYTQKIYVDNAISSNRKVDTSYIFRNATLDSICQVTIINGLSYRSCAKDSLPTVSSTSTTTFTNKRITARVDSTTSSATPTINTDNIDTYKLTAQAVDITSFTTNLTGTPTDDQILHIVIIGTGARAITWGSKFESSTVTLPTTTVSTDRLDVYFIWNTAVSKWRCGGVW